MGSKIEDITVRFEGMVEQMNVLNLFERSGEGRLERVRDGLRSTSSLVDESRVYDRAMDKDEIFQRLMNVEIGDIGVVCEKMYVFLPFMNEKLQYLCTKQEQPNE
ncbi:hypothetical protein SLE2022_176990 [Rubroshorea leprosula]